MKKSTYDSNPVICHTLRIWKQMRYFLNIPTVYIDSPICLNHAFQPTLDDVVFSQWREKGLTTIGCWSALRNINHSSVNARHNLVQFKVIHRLHYSKVKLHKIFPDTSPLCERCKQDEGTLTHLFWTCPKLHVYWALIFDYLSRAFDWVWG